MECPIDELTSTAGQAFVQKSVENQLAAILYL